ncbi:MAG: hypothetical protein ABI540_05465 [Spartobacteria bacterium]
MLLPLLFAVAVAGQALAHDRAVTALASLIDPAKLATLQGARGESAPLEVRLLVA